MSLPQGPPLYLFRQSREPNMLLLDISRQSRWILKQRCDADLEVYAKRIRHSVHLNKYLEAFMPKDGDKAQRLVFILCGTVFYGTVAKIIFQMFNIST
jgi:hypothetical protein